MMLRSLLEATTRRRRDPAAAQDALVVVRSGYHPRVVTARAGVPLRLRFRREEAGPCSESVLLPELGRFAELPEGETVVIDCGPLEAGDYEFSCGEGVLRGTLTVR